MHESPDATVSWAKCNDVLREYDEAMIKGWKEEIDTHLVFVSLLYSIAQFHSPRGLRRAGYTPG